MDLERSINEQSLTTAQKEIFQAFINLNVAISQEVIASFGEAFIKGPAVFIAEQVGSLRENIIETDGRTILFLEKIVNAVGLHLNALETVPEFFQTLEVLTEDAGIEKALIRAKALPHVNNLIERLDCINPTIVDDVIYGKN